MSESMFRRNGIWYTWVRNPRTGETTKRSTGFRDKEAARSRARQIEREVANPEGAAARAYTLGEALEAFVEKSEERSAAKGGKPLALDTVAFYKKKAGVILALRPGSMRLSQVDSAFVESYISERRRGGTSDHTISKELGVLRSALKLARTQKRFFAQVEDVFPSSQEFGATYQPRDRALALSDVAKLLAGNPPERLAVVAFALATGAETSALERARLGDIAADLSHVVIRGSKNANRRDRVVPIVTLECAWLLDFALRHANGEGERLFKHLSNLRRDLQQACDRAGIARVSPHDLRRTFAKWLRARGAESSLVGAALGHADGRMVERVYGRMTRADDLSRALTAQLQNAGRYVDGNRGTSGATRHSRQEPDDQETSVNVKNLVARDGIEPPTRGFSIPCSTN